MAISSSHVITMGIAIIMPFYWAVSRLEYCYFYTGSILLNRQTHVLPVNYSQIISNHCIGNNALYDDCSNLATVEMMQ